MYKSFSDSFENVRKINEQLRKEAENQIDKAEKNASEYKDEINDLNNNISSLEERINDLENENSL